MVCKKCGENVNGSLNFCSNCGKRLRMHGCLVAILVVLGLYIAFSMMVAVITVANVERVSTTSRDGENISVKFKGECPVSVTNVNVEDNIIGYPEISGTFKNLSDKNITAIELYFVPKDVYGDERTNWMSTNYLVSDNILYAGKKDTKTWSFIDQHVKNGDLYLYSVYFEDGTSWGDRDATKSTILKYGKKIDVSFEK